MKEEKQIYIVKANGGIVKSLSFRPGNSSTSIIEKMKNNG